MNFALKFKLNKYFAMYIVGTFILFKTNKNYLKRFQRGYQNEYYNESSN